jgi:hypothetical protein
VDLTKAGALAAELEDGEAVAKHRATARRSVARK